FESFAFDEALYAGYALQRGDGPAVEILPFSGTPHLHNADYVLTVNTPQFARFSGRPLLFVGPRRELLRMVVGRHSVRDVRRRLAAQRQDPHQPAVSTAAVPPVDRRIDRRQPPDSAAEDRVPVVAAGVRSLRRRIRRAAAGRSQG